MFTKSLYICTKYSLLRKNEGDGGNRSNGETNGTLNIFRKAANAGAEFINDAGATMGLLRSKLIKANGRGEIDTIIKEQKNLNPSQIAAIYALYEIGEIGTSSVGADINRGGKKSSAIAQAIDASKNEAHILAYSNGEYRVVSVSNYRKEIAGKPENLNINIVSGVLKMAKITNNFKLLEKYFDLETIENLSMYIQARNYSSRLLPQGVAVNDIIDTYANQKKEKEKKFIDPMFAEIKNRFSQSPEVKKAIDALSIDIGIPLLPSGDVDFLSLQRSFLSKNENQGKDERSIMKDLSIYIGTLRQRVEMIRQNVKKERDEIIQKLGTKITLFDHPGLENIDTNVLDSRGKAFDLRKTPIQTINGAHARKLLAEIGKKYPNNIPKDLIDIILLLGLQIKNNETVYKIGELTEAERQTQKGQKIETKKTQSAGRIAEIAGVKEDTKALLGNKSDTELQKEQSVLEAKSSLTLDEEKRLATLKQSRIHSNDIAQVYAQVRAEYGEGEAQEIFQKSFEIGRGYPLSESEHIDYKSLESIAIITDPESTNGDIKLSQMQLGVPIGIDSLFEENENINSIAPELSTIDITKNNDGSYNIPLFEAKNITKKQVEEYKETIRLYAGLGLSQFIPHIPILTTRMKEEGISTNIDGINSTKEQQNVIKFLYKKIFGKEIITTNLGDIERAFLVYRGNYMNIKDALQPILKEIELIPDSGRGITHDALLRWLNKKNNPEPIGLNLT